MGITVSGLESVSSEGEIALFFGDFGDSFVLLVGSQFSSDGPGEFGPQEEGSFVGVFVGVAGDTVAFFAVEGSQIAGDVLADAFDLGQFGSAA